jgi:O-antigen ligase
MADLITRYGLVAIVLCLPLEFTSTFLVTQLVRWLLLIVGVAYAYLLATHQRQFVIPRSASAVWLAAFVIAAAASWLATRAPGSANDLLDILIYPAVGLLVANLVHTQDDHRRFWLALLASGLAIGVLGAALYLANTHIWMPNPLLGRRMNITFADPNITARFLALCACVAVLMFSARQGPSWLSIATAVVCGAVLPITFSRSGLALLIITVAFAVMVAFNRRRAALIGGVAVLVFALSTGINPETRQRAIDAATTVVTAVTGTTHNVASGAVSGQGAVTLEDNRRYLVAAGLQMFQDHPVSGIGFGGYQHALLTTYHAFLPNGFTDSVSHTAVVTVLAEMGLVGAILLLGFLVQLARETFQFRQRRDEWALWGVISATLVVPIFLFSQFEARFVQEPYLWLVLGMGYSAQMLASRKRAPVAAERRERRTERRRIEVA